ncbi:sugar ABC transporter permease [Mediterraneibacter sp. NSJ-55]|uniref:Sugar ABC transporter permease n=1 Tax=Mediterraneibacter hominis TaxID=2763054 RepID=A0A923RQ48_9FIRM|nr:sugar ABC transporter permease [Mediterraneibacter hominis]MBC5689116.1 sugar ABC transporter permease [Mediterraneibacter hominis]
MKPKKRTLIVFLTPCVFLFLFVYLFPLIMVIVTSFFNWRIGENVFFVGLANYMKGVADPNVQAACWHTMIWVILQSTIHVLLGTVLALILLPRFKGWKIFRTVCMLPNVISTAALAMVLLNVFKTDSGLLNEILRLFTGSKVDINWYFNADTAFFSVMAGWLLYPGMITILMLAAMQSVPEDILEAAKLDGATSWQINTRIVLPMVRNTLGTSVIVAATSMLKEFELIYLTTNGGPGNATLNFPLYIYKTAFTENNYGYSNALSVMLIIIGVAIVMLINKMFRMDQSDY